ANADDIRQAFERLYEENKEYLELSSYSGGIGGKTNGAGDIRKSYNDAVNAMKYGVMTGGINKTYDMNGLGLYKLIIRMGSREEMESFIPNNLRRLIEYDSASKNVLVNTLDVFLQCDCNITKAASVLDIHYKSLVYRISRIKEIMELDTLDGDVRLEIQLAFKILHIMNSMNQ
ncbi:MAG: helix-turn-helix domain-containing protein, partial [Clostridia bacterium]|nr:helix-turn-helix domain-containing protein [Clostridia bacterium]